MLATMARRPQPEQLAPPCATAETRRQFSVGYDRNKPLVTFVNGFQKRLAAYKKAGPCQANPVTASDSESDISSLEIDSNLSDSSILSDPASPKPPPCLPSPGTNNLLDDTLKTQSSERCPPSSHSSERKELIRLPNSTQSGLFEQQTDTNNSRQQPGISTQHIAPDDHCLNNGATDSTPHERRESEPVRTGHPSPPATAHQRGHTLVLKIRRRTWTHDAEGLRDDSTHRPQTEGSLRSGHSATDARNCRRIVRLGEWQNVTEDCAVLEPVAQDGAAGAPLPANTGKTFPRRKSSQTRKHRHKAHRSRPVREDCFPQRNGSRPKQRDVPKHKYRNKRRTSKKPTASKKRSKVRTESHAGQTLRLPSDPQKAVRVLEKALESINAQIKQLKRETKLEESRAGKLKCRLGRKKESGRDWKRLSKGDKKKHSKESLSAVPAAPRFNLSDMFPVVPSLIVRDNDLHPAYKSSLDPGLRPLASHPIWHWRVGQPPLPKTGHHSPDN